MPQSNIQKNSGVFHHNKMKLEHAMDNEFELVFVVGYQNFLKVSYIGKWSEGFRWNNHREDASHFTSIR